MSKLDRKTWGELCLLVEFAFLNTNISTFDDLGKLIRQSKYPEVIQFVKSLAKSLDIKQSIEEQFRIFTMGLGRYVSDKNLKKMKEHLNIPEDEAKRIDDAQYLASWMEHYKNFRLTDKEGIDHMITMLEKFDCKEAANILKDIYDKYSKC